MLTLSMQLSMLGQLAATSAMLSDEGVVSAVSILHPQEFNCSRHPAIALQCRVSEEYLISVVTR